MFILFRVGFRLFCIEAEVLIKSYQEIILQLYSPFCVPAKVTKLIGLKRPPFLSPTNLITFASTQNGELQEKP
jgi:hypothetical protein